MGGGCCIVLISALREAAKGEKMIGMERVVVMKSVNEEW